MRAECRRCRTSPDRSSDVLGGFRGPRTHPTETTYFPSRTYRISEKRGAGGGGFPTIYAEFLGHGTSTLLTQGFDDQRKVDEGDEDEIRRVEATEDAAEALEPAEQPFDLFAASIAGFLDGPRVGAVWVWRHDGDESQVERQLARRRRESTGPGVRLNRPSNSGKRRNRRPFRSRPLQCR